METEFLNPKAKLVDAVVEWLVPQARKTPAGVASLAHVLVVVPTAQAGRQLRFALAQEFSGRGVLPPEIRPPIQVVRGRAAERVNPAEELAIFVRVLRDLTLADYPDLFPVAGRPQDQSSGWAVSLARQLRSLADRLSENGLTFADVATRIGGILRDEDLDREVARWQDLAQIEARVLAAFHERKLMTPAERIAAALKDPECPVGIEKIVLPALVDPVPVLLKVLPVFEERDGMRVTVLVHADAAEAARFDAWGRPRPDAVPPWSPLADGSIVRSSSTGTEAQAVAADYREGATVGLADASLFPELEAAFLARNVVLHNPARHPLAASSLGRLIRRAERLLAPDCDWATAAAFVRDDDVRAWLEAHRVPWAALVTAMDAFQNRALPRRLADGQDVPEIAAFLRLLPPRGTSVEAFLRILYQGRVIHSATPGDREFAAAAAAAEELFEMTRPADLAPFFDALFDEQSYQLEPESSTDVLAEGWLELAWSPAEHVLVAGFNEGAVPDAIVGHPFLPDRLAAALGLESNDRRMARDAYLLDEILRCRAADGVRLHLAAANAAGDVLKPSRLLFRCDDKTFLARAPALYAMPEDKAPTPARGPIGFWRLRLKAAEPVTSISPSGIDAYLADPFAFFLRQEMGLGGGVRDHARELDALAFGTVCHDALAAFADSPAKDTADEKTIAAFFDGWLATCFPGTSVILALQREAVRARLAKFATWQAHERAAGWKIEAAEGEGSCPLGPVTVKGRYDRLDVNEKTGRRRVIDYKTWKSYDGHAPWEQKRDRSWFFTSLQLPLYVRMTPGDVEAGYYVLGEEDALQAWHPVLPGTTPEADVAIRTKLAEVAQGLAHGIFWPPAAALPPELVPFFPDPVEESVDPGWLAEQKRRIGGAR